MAARKTQIVPKDPEVVEVTEPDVDYRDAGTGQFVTEEYAEEHPDTTVSETEEPDDVALPDSTPHDEEQAFRQWVVETLNGFDERIRDIEVTAGSQLLPGLFGESHVFRADAEVEYREPNEDEDVPDYVNGVQESFNRGEGDDVPWLT